MKIRVLRWLAFAGIGAAFVTILSAEWTVTAGVLLLLWCAADLFIFLCVGLTAASCLIALAFAKELANYSFAPADLPVAGFLALAVGLAFRKRLAPSVSGTDARSHRVLFPAVIALLLLAVFRYFPLGAHLMLSVALLLVWRGRGGRFVRPRLRDRRWVSTALLAITSASISFAVLELGARWFIFPFGLPGNVYVYDSRLGVVVAPGTKGYNQFRAGEHELKLLRYEISAQGLRDVVHGPKQPGEFRIAMLGDSYTFGVTNDFEGTIPRQLQRLFDERVPKRHVTVMNIGFGATGPWQQSVLLRERGFPLAPDLVVHQVLLGNDVADTLEKRGEVLEAYDPRRVPVVGQWRNYRHARFWPDYWLRKRSAAYNAFRKAVGLWRIHRFLASGTRLLPVILLPNPPPPPARPSFMEVNLVNGYPRLEQAWNETLADLAGIVQDCRDREIGYVAYTLPNWPEVSDDEWRSTLAGVPGVAYERGKGRQRFASEMDRAGVQQFSIFEALHEQLDINKLYYIYDGHMTDEGNRVVAERIFAWLTQDGGPLADRPSVAAP